MKPVLINDRLFEETGACPLKKYLLLQRDDNFDAKPLFRQRNKPGLWDTAASRVGCISGIRYMETNGNNSFRLIEKFGQKNGKEDDCGEYEF